MDETLVLMEGIEKSFPGVHALSECQFELRSGEVHALVGENGAGKSTLMKVLAGVYYKDAGRILYKGQEVEIPNPRAALDLGISMIHQELNLMPHLTVAQNIFIGREPRKGPRFWLDEAPAQPPGRAALRLDAPAHGPDRQGRQTLGCQATDGGDRQGVFPQRRSAHHG